MNGILPVYKPTGMTSYDVIRRFKKDTGFREKVGHGGTLDPFAEGVLLLLLGESTKLFEEIRKWQKVYRAVAVLGAKSETLDLEGKIEKQKNLVIPSLREVEETARNMVGEIEQEVPKYAAAKYKGVPLYKLAREGKVVPRKSKKVHVYHVSIKHYEFPECEFEVDVGSGTYIRQLSWDMFMSLGMQSYLKKLVRLAVGKITIEDVCSLEEFGEGWREKVIKLEVL